MTKRKTRESESTRDDHMREGNGLRTRLLNMSPREAKMLDRGYTLLVEQTEEAGDQAAKRLTKLLARIIVRNVRAGRAGGAE